MTWREFVATIVNSTAWPIAAIVGVVLLRRPLADIVSLLRKVRYGGFEADLGEIAAAQEAMPTVGIDSSTIATIPATSDSDSGQDHGRSDDEQPTIAYSQPFSPYVREKQQPEKMVPLHEYVGRIADSNPRLAVAEAWGRLEPQLGQAYRSVGRSPIGRPIAEIVDHLVGLGVLSSETGRAVKALARMKERAETSNPTVEEVQVYARAAERSAREIREAIKASRQPR